MFQLKIPLFLLLTFLSIPTVAAGAKDSDAVCTVDVGTVMGTVPPGLYGTNVEWFNNANGLWKQGGLDENLIRLAREQGITAVRFPGGTQSDFYDWRDGIGPQSMRPRRPHNTDPSSSPNPFGTPELMSFCSQIGAKPLLTVNAGKNDPTLAAAWVEYCNTPGNTQRTADGSPDPYAVQFWEIGNELYLDGSDAEKSISTSPREYANRFLQYAQAMRRVDPSIKLMALGIAPSYSIPFGPYSSEWSPTVLPIVASEADYVAVHNAYFPFLFPRREWEEKEVYQSLWAAPEAVSRSLTRLEELITKEEKQREINIAVTEWGAFYAFDDPHWTNHIKTLGTAIYAARIMQVFLAHPRVKLANYFKFTDDNLMGWVSGKGEPKVPYYVIQLFTQHFGTRLVQSNIEGPTYESNQVGFALAESKVPELTSVASLNNAGDRLYVNIVNRSWDQKRTMRINISNFPGVHSKAVAWVLAGPAPTAHNGPDLPEWWPIPVIPPGGKEIWNRPVRIERQEWDITVPVTLPPHSVVVLEFER